MKLRRIISGGQTGADRTGLECARELGIETGGIAPQGWRTEDGADPSLATFGLEESQFYGYAARTAANVRNSDATLWFGDPTSPGGRATRRLCDYYHKPFLINLPMIPSNLYAIINIAGNRASKNPAIIEQVRQAFQALKKEASL
jgi:hypothetical protein